MEFGPVIKNPVLDINKLVLQGTLLNQSVQNVEGDSTADQATVDLLARKDPVIQEISVGMSGEELTQYTVSGTPPLSLPNSLGKPLKAWEVDVLPYQEGSGDPAPNNVRPIHGTDKLTITTAGKNLYSREDSVYNVPVYAQDGTSASYPDVAVWWMPAKPNTNYTISCNHNEQIFYVRWINCDSNKGFINRVGSSFTEVSLPITTTTPANCRWVQIAINQYPVGQIAQNDWEVMVVEGSTATDYEPYNGSQTVLTLPKTVYTGTIGSDGGESRDGEIDLGTLNWIPATATGRTNSYMSPLSPKVPTSATVTPYNLCTQYKQITQVQWYNTSETGITICGNGYGGNGAIGISDPALANKGSDEIKAYLSGIKLVYKVANPTQFPIPASTIPTPTGTATTWATAEDGTVDSMEVTYIGKA